MTEIIVGRDKEKKKIKELYDSSEPVLFLWYGRRRIGKTWLVTKTFEHDPSCFFLSFKAEYELKKEPKIQSYNMRKEVNKILQKNDIHMDQLKFNEKEPVWPETFYYIEQAIELLMKKDPTKKIVIFFDELPWFYIQRDKKFMGVLSHFWTKFITQHPNSSKIKIFSSGSATRSILNNLLKAKGGLFQNSNSRRVDPFDLKETRDFLKAKNITFINNEDLIKLYFAVGGVADYLDQFKPHHSVDSFINEFYFKNTDNYNINLSDFLKSSFDEHPTHKTVLDAIGLSKKGVTQEEIRVATKLDNKELKQILIELKETTLITYQEEFSPTSKVGRASKNKPQIESEKMKPKNRRYKITDEMILFHYYWLNGNQNNNTTWNSNVPLHSEWKGRLFENICFKHFHYIADAKQYVSGSSYDIHYWANTKADVDLLTDRQGVIDLFEMKCYEKGFDMPHDYLNKLLNKKKEMLNWISGFKKNILVYKKKEILITIVSFNESTIPKDCLGRDKICQVINFSQTF